MQYRPSTHARRPPLRITCAVVSLVAVAVALPFAVGAQQRFVTIERFVPHTSTVPMTAGTP